MESLDIEYDYHRNYQLILNKKIYMTKGLCGLLNLGNKCYLNSILQCLFATLKMSDYFLSGKYKEDFNERKRGGEYYVMYSYATLLNNIFEENQLIKPRSLIENMGKFHKKYLSTEQQDSHEFLLHILEILHRSISYEIEVEIKGEIKSHSDTLMKKYLENWSKFYEKDYSFLVEIFNGSLVNNIKCSNCSYRDEIFEPYNNLSVSLPETSATVSLETCLDNYFGEHVEEIDTWNCEKCKGKGCVKSVDLWTLPNYFIINLKRFKKVDNCILSKNTNNVVFPLKNLDLTKYVSKEKSDLNKYTYDCYAINYHTGNINGGHYFSAVKNLDGHWYNTNDGDVSRYNDTSQLVNSDAYILFYTRRYIIEPKTM